ncbi:MAG TPA: hypothetical protein ENH01_04375 [Nitrospirae bacterium]|nr:hypothetical protein [Nitrospirota bacterium]
MKGIKNLIIGLLVGIIIGLWFGVNIGKEKPLFSNPLAERTMQEKLKQAGEDVLEKSGEAIKKGGKALREKLKD